VEPVGTQTLRVCSSFALRNIGLGGGQFLVSLRALRARLEFSYGERRGGLDGFGRSEASGGTEGDRLHAYPLLYPRQDSWNLGNSRRTHRVREFLGVSRSETRQERSVRK